jgi:TRAP-type transport system periplasmic protein
MRMSTRQTLALGIAAPVVLRFGQARAASALKISHQSIGARLIKLATEAGA